MTGTSPKCEPHDVLDYSCDSDSNDTVVLKDEDTYNQSENGVSFVRFVSLDGNATTDGDLVPMNTQKQVCMPKLSALPTELSFLNSYPYLLSSNLPPRSFMFTDCRIEMGLDPQKQRPVVENPISSTPEPIAPPPPPLSHNLVEIAPKALPPQIAVAPQPPTETPPIPPPTFKPPKPVQLSDIRCKNREAARKCRAKKKNYIQQLEHDYKELKVALNVPFFLRQLSFLPFWLLTRSCDSF